MWICDDEPNAKALSAQASRSEVLSSTKRSFEGPKPFEVLLQCSFSSEVDVGRLEPHQKCVVLKGSGPWTVGRQNYSEVFASLVPNESLRSLISRNHFELACPPGDAKPALVLRKLSQNALLVDGVAVAQVETRLEHGTTIGFCGRTASETLLLFRVFVREVVNAGTPTTPSRAPGTPTTPSTRSPEKRPPFYLMCTTALGHDVATLPSEAKTLGLQFDESTRVGRQHQAGLFENLLSQGQGTQYLCCVSRSHFEVTPLPREAPGCFQITNHSPNPIVLCCGDEGLENRLEQGQKGLIRPGYFINFIAAGNREAHVTFLRFGLGPVGR